MMKTVCETDCSYIYKIWIYVNDENSVLIYCSHIYNQYEMYINDENSLLIIDCSYIHIYYIIYKPIIGLRGAVIINSYLDQSLCNRW